MNSTNRFLCLSISISLKNGSNLEDMIYYGFLPTATSGAKYLTLKWKFQAEWWQFFALCADSLRFRMAGCEMCSYLVFKCFFFFLCSSLKWVSHVHMKTRQIRMNSFTRNARISAHPILLESPQSFLLYFSDANSKNPHLAKITIFSSFAEKFPV